MSGVRREQRELEELIWEMWDARQDLLSRKEERRTTALEREFDKERIGAAILRHANKRMHSPSEETFEKDSTTATSSSCRRHPRSEKSRIQMDPFKDDVLVFTEALEKGDEVRSEIQQKRIMLEQRRLECEIEERAGDREERKRERDDDRKLELKKHRTLTQAFMRSTDTGT